jgi:hypothetical protein
MARDVLRKLSLKLEFCKNQVWMDLIQCCMMIGWTYLMFVITSFFLQLIFSTVSISPLEPSSRTLYWYSHHSYLQFQIACFTFLLVLFDSLAGKAFLARSIKLCLVDNQQSSGVTVAGFESCLIWSRITNVEISINQTYQLPLGRSGLYSSQWLDTLSGGHFPGRT